MPSRLIYRLILGTITPAERAELDAWIAEDHANRDLVRSITDLAALESEMRRRRAVDVRRPAADMRRRIEACRAPRRRRALAVAASVAILIGLGVSFFISRPSSGLFGDDSQSLAVTVADIDSIMPGRTIASLTIPGGETIPLDSRSSGASASSINAIASASLPSVAKGSVAPEARQLCLDVPRGGEFRIVLSDSTEVWLNSQSQLHFPETFSPDERRVSVTGEAYFAVRHEDDRPFIVETAGQCVKVLGTTFNVRYYPEDSGILTTLESGSISLTRADGIGGAVVLSPGFQTSFDISSSKVSLTNVDPEVITSWRKGRFVFENQPLRIIMQDLSRWYDFDYAFVDSSVAGEQFMGSIPRYSDFRTAISIIEKCGFVSFDIDPDSGRVLVSRKK